MKYRLDAHGLMAGGYRITYSEFNGDTFNWKNKLFDFFYDIVEEIPQTKEYNKGEFQDATIYKMSLDDAISDCILKLNEIRYEELDEIVTRETEFHRELTSLLNRYSKENVSDTPDFILASYISGCLINYNSTVTQREKWFEREKKRKDITDEHH